MNTGGPRRPWWRRFLIGALWFLLTLAALLVVRCWFAFRDQNPGYELTLDLDATESIAAPRSFQVGFGRVPINPDLSDPKRPVWLAGFSQNRAATALHDSLWSHACVLDDGYRRVGIVSLDAIGFFHDDVIEVRRRLEASWRLDHTIVCSTHNHSAPDLMGLWGPHPLKTGVDPRYREQVITAAAHALGQAVGSLKPARVAAHEIALPPEGLVNDTRKPLVFDADLRVLHFTALEGDGTLGTLVAWGNHPETVWSQNTEITSDFCGYVREALEHGIRLDGQRHAEGLGGIHVYLTGAVGGLMTTDRTVTVRDPYLDKEFRAPSHEKARALGHQLASRLLPQLRSPDPSATNHAPISVHARTLELPVDNPVFFLAPVLGLIDRGHARWKTMRTEIALITVGPASIACLPGEVYPEIVNGGIERAPGGDFDCEPVEVPPLRALMPGKVKFVLGLANDEIGYIIPKSQWDQEPPYLYGSSRRVYGEINSVGPETAPRLHRAFAALCPMPR